MGFMERPLPHHPQLVLFLEFRLPDPPVEWATGLKLSQIQLKILTVCIHFLFMKGTGLLLTLLGYGEIKGDTFPDDDVDQGKKCNGCICNVFGWRKHSMSMYFSCILLPLCICTTPATSSLVNYMIPFLYFFVFCRIRIHWPIQSPIQTGPTATLQSIQLVNYVITLFNKSAIFWYFNMTNKAFIFNLKIGVHNK